MKKILLPVILLCVFTAIFSQTKPISFLPKWKVGEKKTVTIVERKKEVEDGNTKKDTTESSKAEISVVAESKDDYTVKIVYDNLALNSVTSLLSKPADLGKYKSLDLKYSVNKRDGKVELINWKEVETFMVSSFDLLNAILKDKEPDMAPLAKSILGPIREQLKGKTNVQSYMEGEIGYLLYPYDKKLGSRDTLKTEQSMPSPFKAGDSLNTTTITYLSNINETAHVCDINKVTQYDLSKFMAMMKTLMAGMSKNMGSDGKKKDAQKEMEKELAKMKFDISQREVTTFDYNTSWPLKIVNTKKSAVSAGGKNMERTTSITTTFK
ncbi:MAG: hypothetical protein JWO06_3939 [Bacteroidota bacterium]|nr:hypothetical protein [Bacteroidota bacterium]